LTLKRTTFLNIVVGEGKAATVKAFPKNGQAGSFVFNNRQPYI